MIPSRELPHSQATPTQSGNEETQVDSLLVMYMYLVVQVIIFMMLKVQHGVTLASGHFQILSFSFGGKKIEINSEWPGNEATVSYHHTHNVTINIVAGLFQAVRMRLIPLSSVAASTSAAKSCVL